MTIDLSNMIISAKDAAQLAGFNAAQSFLVHIAVRGGGLQVHRFEQGKRCMVLYFIRAELLAWIKENPRTSADRRKYYKSNSSLAA